MATFSIHVYMHFKNSYKVYLSILQYWILDGLKVYLTNISTNNFPNNLPIIFLKMQIVEVKISPKVYLKHTSCLEYRGIFEV